MRSFDFVVDWLRRGEGSEPYRLDPSGDEPLTTAKRVRRAALRRGGRAQVNEEAAQRFGLPHSALRFAQELPSPLFPPARAAAPNGGG